METALVHAHYYQNQYGGYGGCAYGKCGYGCGCYGAGPLDWIKAAAGTAVACVAPRPYPHENAPCANALQSARQNKANWEPGCATCADVSLSPAMAAACQCQGFPLLTDQVNLAMSWINAAQTGQIPPASTQTGNNAPSGGGVSYDPNKQGWMTGGGGGGTPSGGYKIPVPSGSDISSLISQYPLPAAGIAIVAALALYRLL